jgi:4-aminobutyrate aminotransferase
MAAALMRSPVTNAGTPAPSESDTNLSQERRAWAARNLDAAGRALLAQDERYFLRQSVSTPCLNAIVKAEGIFIQDTAGRRMMDFHGNNVHHIGYGHPRLKRAIAEQMEALPFTPRRYTSEPAVALAEKLAAIAPGNLGKVLFTTGGSDAIEVAIKLARAATGRYKTLSFWDAFHGAGFGSAAVGGEALFRSGPVGPLMPGAEHVAPFSSYRCPYGTSSAEESSAACARMIDYVLGREGDVAVLIAEPVRAVPYIPAPGFWKEVRKICDRHGTLLVFDEIPTGLGKTGKMFACEHDGVVPDMLVLGKALGGGILPIAAVIARPEFDVGADYAFGHYTHEKNPVTARAALTTI